MGLFSSKKRKKPTSPERSGPSRPQVPLRDTSSHRRSPLRPRPQDHHQLSHSSPQQLPLGQALCWPHDQQPQCSSGMAVQPAGYLPPPPDWSPPSHLPLGQAPPSYNNSQQRPCPPIVVNQYYLHPPNPGRAITTSKSTGALNKLGDSVVNITNDVVTDVIPQIYDDSLTAWQTYGTQMVNQTAAMVDQISSRLNHIMTMIDVEKISGHERDLFTYRPPLASTSQQVSRPLNRERERERARERERGKDRDRDRDRDRAPAPKARKGDKNAKSTAAVAVAVASSGYFAKVDLYANSRLPQDLSPLKLYVSTWPLICAAASYSERVYAAPKGAEKDTHVSANWRGGTRAMVIKSVPMDDQSVIVFAIRGTATFMDWAVNLNMEPTSPVGFLDDPGNLCHAGFLSSARSMVKPVAARLRQLLKDKPGRKDSSLVITGHSAGGAVAALLYSHMYSSSKGAQSELRKLAGAFKRIHCITFGSPPVSLLPLAKPDSLSLRKSVFMSFINEGDPVTRADKAYVKSLVELLAAPDPKTKSSTPGKAIRKEKSRLTLSSKKARLVSKSSSSLPDSDGRAPTWRVPNCTLSLAGRIVVLRSREPNKGGEKRTLEERMKEGVVAHTAGDDDVRGVVWGDPMCHVMRFYSRRVEALAVEAITARK